MHYPSKEQFLKLSKKGNLIPISMEIMADLETPVSAYLKIASGSKHSFLLESVEGQEKLARYSFLAQDPDLILKTKNRQAEIVFLKNGKKRTEKRIIKDTPLSIVREILAKYKLVEMPQLPPFIGGMVGFLGYDVVRFFERLPNKPKDDLKLPDMYLVLSKDVIIFDHLNHKITLVSSAHIDMKASPQKKLREYDNSVKKINKMAEKLKQPLSVKKASQKAKKFVQLRPHSNVSKAQFKKIVSLAKNEIRKGEIIQVVLSQRFSAKINTDALNVYRSLRLLNPSPYMYYLNFDGVQIVGSSPELLIRCENNIVATRPIAGTRRRGKTEAEDKKLEQELLNDPKEKAEHIMLVDLGRNDLGRVCRRGTVKVSEFMNVERYSHVMHIVSNVQGHLRSDKDALDVLQASFPAGTVSGAPKIRAMEIIDRLENVSRGPYAGCIGYFSFSGNLDSCITIRTIVISKNRAYNQAGAGIVADSVPENEYKETLNKAKAQLTAIELAHKSL